MAACADHEGATSLSSLVACGGEESDAEAAPSMTGGYASVCVCVCVCVCLFVGVATCMIV